MASCRDQGLGLEGNMIGSFQQVLRDGDPVHLFVSFERPETPDTLQNIERAIFVKIHGPFYI